MAQPNAALTPLGWGFFVAVHLHGRPPVWTRERMGTPVPWGLGSGEGGLCAGGWCAGRLPLGEPKRGLAWVAQCGQVDGWAAGQVDGWTAEQRGLPSAPLAVHISGQNWSARAKSGLPPNRAKSWTSTYRKQRQPNCAKTWAARREATAA
jgi:hypothetical protein